MNISGPRPSENSSENKREDKGLAPKKKSAKEKVDVRENELGECHTDFSSIFAEGSFKHVYTGIYRSGSRQGQKCAVKQFINGAVTIGDIGDIDFDYEHAVHIEANALIRGFNKAGIIGRKVVTSLPETWTNPRTEVRYLVEPFLKGFDKYNSTSGWAAESSVKWSDEVQALSHFSYDYSFETHLLCDILEALVGNVFVIADPVVMSLKKRYGPSDGADDYIKKFFKLHHCGRFCKPDWIRPTGEPTISIPVKEGTTMIEPPFESKFVTRVGKRNVARGQ